MIPERHNSITQHILTSTHVYAQATRHLIIGGSGVLFNWLMFTLLRQYAGLDTLQSTIIVHVLLLIMIFPTQKFFTFKSRSRSRHQIVRFLVNDGLYVSFDFLLAAFFIDWLDMLPVVGKALGLMILAPFSFISQRYWVFRGDSK